MRVAVQDNLPDAGKAAFLKAAACCLHGGRLDIKGQNLSVFSGKAAEKFRIAAVSGGSVNAESAGLYMLSDILVAPFGDLITFHGVFLLKRVRDKQIYLDYSIPKRERQGSANRLQTERRRYVTGQSS